MVDGVVVSQDDDKDDDDRWDLVRACACMCLHGHRPQGAWGRRAGPGRCRRARRGACRASASPSCHPAPPRLGGCEAFDLMLILICRPRCCAGRQGRDPAEPQLRGGRLELGACLCWLAGWHWRGRAGRGRVDAMAQRLVLRSAGMAQHARVVAGCAMAGSHGWQAGLLVCWTWRAPPGSCRPAPFPACSLLW